ncbi:universal stress protein [Anaeromyxobacter sp. PSR-1]|uniref:universal stress protein n=1 Tax=unclassified Anaeromyxobacter TaxID=2620896 RepID=UPI0005E2A92D|nr:universal stress protein [Anaeromyxobacter sp. PSR-1]GAO02403.1 universal stress protein family protein [Anaeromyxobacter sp. PSR-1]
MRSWHRILCAVDLSEASRATVTTAADLAHRTGAELALVHVHEPLARAEARAAARDPARLEAQAQRLGAELQRWRGVAQGMVGRPVRALLASGGAAGEILRELGEGGYDLVVIGAHPHRRLGRTVGGAVAARVVREAPCQVLVAHQPAHAVEAAAAL